MPTSAIATRFLRFFAVFGSLRAIEFLAAFAALLVISAVELPQASPSDWSLARESAGAWLIARVYYFGFHYFLLSAIAFAVAEVVWGLNRLRVTTLTNVGAFIVHSIVFASVVFTGDFGAFWVAWAVVLLVNWLAPAVVTRVFQEPQ